MQDNFIISLQLTKWEKYQGRNDVITPWWFKFNNKFFTGPDLQTLTVEEKYIFIFMLCEASQQNKKGLLVISEQFIMAYTNTSKSAISSTLKKLKEINMIEKLSIESVRNPYTIRTQSVRQNRIEKRREEKRITTKRALAPSKNEGAPSFTQEFIIIYDNALKARYGVKAKLVITPKIAGQIKKLVADIGLIKACDLIQVYFQMDDPWFLKRGHDFGTFLNNLQKIALALDTGLENPTSNNKSISELLAERESNAKRI